MTTFDIDKSTLPRIFAGEEIMKKSTSGKSTLTPFVLQTRPALLIACLCMLLNSPSLCSQSEIAKKYPPYPEVWDWTLPNSRVPMVLKHLKLLDDGDVLVTYREDSPPEKFKQYGIKFFSRERVSDDVLHALCGNKPCEDETNVIPYKEGQVINAEGGQTRSGRCYNRLSGAITTKDKSSWKLLTSRTLLFILEKPKQWITEEHCNDGPSFDYYVDSVFPRFFPLSDGTFLVRDFDHGLIVRLDQDFQTKSHLINKSLFWMNTRELDIFEAKYGDRAVTEKNMKQLQFDLYHLLLKRKQGD